MQPFNRARPQPAMACAGLAIKRPLPDVVVEVEHVERLDVKRKVRVPVTEPSSLRPHFDQLNHGPVLRVAGMCNRTGMLAIYFFA